MSLRHPQAAATTRGQMEVPQAVIAQAEAAASSNQPEDEQGRAPFVPNQTPEAFSSKESRSRSSASDQKYANLTYFLLQRPSYSAC